MSGRSVDKSVDGVGRTAGRAPVVAALDLGQSKVACVIMKAEGVRHADRTIRVAGAGHVQSRGVRGGGIVNMDEAAQAIGHAVERAERAAGSPVSGVVVTTAIGQMASHRVQARVSLGATPVGDADLARAIGMALAQIRLPNRRPIHVLPIAWSVDGARGVHDPRSMKGHSLGLDLLVVSMAEGMALHGPRVMHPPRPVDRPGDRQHMDRPPVGQADLRQGHGDGPRQVGVPDRIGPQRDAGLHPVAGHLADGRGDDDARDRRAGGALGPLDREADGLGRLVHVDDAAAANAARLDVAGPGDANGAVGVAHAVGLHDEAADLGLAEIQRRHDRRATRGGFSAIHRLVHRPPSHTTFLSYASPAEGRTATSSGVLRSIRANPSSRSRSRWSSASSWIRAAS